MSVRLGLPGTSVPIDKDRLRRAVVNVFENAYEALGEGAGDSPVCEQLVVLCTGESHHRIEIVIGVYRTRFPGHKFVMRRA